MSVQSYLVFGDLHGRILPAFRLATLWSREHATPLSGLLQVGDLGWYPDLSRIDRATKRHAEKDPTELGAVDVATPNELADFVFDDPDCPCGMWFIMGNHEDFDDLSRRSGSAGRRPDFVVDAYCRICCIRDGWVTELPGGLRVGGLWGIDGEGPHARRNLPEIGYLSQRNMNRLLGEEFHVLLTHDSFVDAILPDVGSESLKELISLIHPPLHFFGHYGGPGRQVETTGTTSSWFLRGMTLLDLGGTAEYGSVGVLRLDGKNVEFEFLPEKWLRNFSRHNWKFR